MYDDIDPEDIKPWHITAFFFVIFVLAGLAAYTLSNVLRSVA